MIGFRQIGSFANRITYLWLVCGVKPKSSTHLTRRNVKNDGAFVRGVMRFVVLTIFRYVMVCYKHYMPINIKKYGHVPTKEVFYDWFFFSYNDI